MRVVNCLYKRGTEGQRRFESKMGKEKGFSFLVCVARGTSEIVGKPSLFLVSLISGLKH